MADPLSISASVIALGQAACAAEQAVGKVKSFLGAAAELDVLLNEIASIGLIAAGIGEGIRLRSSNLVYNQSTNDNLSLLLKKTKEELLELQKVSPFSIDRQLRRGASEGKPNSMGSQGAGFQRATKNYEA